MSELFDVLGGETVLFGAVYMELQLLAKEIECMAASNELQQMLLRLSVTPKFPKRFLLLYNLNCFYTQASMRNSAVAATSSLYS